LCFTLYYETRWAILSCFTLILDDARPRSGWVVLVWLGWAGLCWAGLVWLGWAGLVWLGCAGLAGLGWPGWAVLAGIISRFWQYLIISIYFHCKSIDLIDLQLRLSPVLFGCIWLSLGGGGEGCCFIAIRARRIQIRQCTPS